jgi:hypothetical protein
MYDFLLAGWGLAKDLQACSATHTAKMDAFLAWQYAAVVGRFGSGAAGTFNYRYAEANYTVQIAPRNDAEFEDGSGPWFADWGAVAAAMGIPAADGGTSLFGESGGDPTVMDEGYWGNVHPALAYAVDHGATGALEGWQRLVASSSYSGNAVLFNDTPEWGVKPRTV